MTTLAVAAQIETAETPKGRAPKDGAPTDRPPKDGRTPKDGCRQGRTLTKLCNMKIISCVRFELDFRGQIFTRRRSIAVAM